MTEASLIDKLLAEKCDYAETQHPEDLAYNNGVDDAIAIVRQHQAEVMITNDRVCIAGKWYVPADGGGDPRAPKSLDKCTQAAKGVFDMSLVGPDTGFKAEDVAKAVLDAAGVAYE